MKPVEDDDRRTVLTDEDLVQLQLQIAQRADELAHCRGASRAPSDDYAYWLEAEREVLGPDPGDPAERWSRVRPCNH